MVDDGGVAGDNKRRTFNNTTRFRPIYYTGNVAERSPSFSLPTLGGDNIREFSTTDPPWRKAEIYYSSPPHPIHLRALKLELKYTHYTCATVTRSNILDSNRKLLLYGMLCTTLTTLLRTPHRPTLHRHDYGPIVFDNEQRNRRRFCSNRNS